MPGQLADPMENQAARQARDSAYDAVVVGAGIGGLTAGALLARSGKKVLVVEAEAQPGGYARALRRGPYTFDRADHLIMGCAADGPFGQGVVDAVLRHLGVGDRCPFVRMESPFYVARYPGLTVSVPGGREGFLEAHLRHFPGEAAGLRRLVETSAEIYREVLRFPTTPRLRDLLLLPRRLPTAFRYRNATLKDVMDRELADPRLKALYATLWTWIGLPPGKASFLTWAVMMAAFVDDGAFYSPGSFQRLADALASGLTRAGGELLLGTRATRILAEGRRVRGVALEGGQEVRAPVVVSNIDARETFERLLGPDEVPPRYLRRLRRMEPSPFALALYAATDLDPRALGAEHDTTLCTGWDHDRAYAGALAGEVTDLSILVPTLKDPALAPPGQHLVILKAAAPAHAGQEGAGHDELADRMLALAEVVLPGLREHLTFVEESSPVTGPRSRLDRMGPIYGWAVSPGQSGVRRLPQKTPLRGLLLAGHWTQPGHGISFVVASGVAAARLALGRSTSAPVLPLAL
jgi:prolycopene isomerase